MYVQCSRSGSTIVCMIRVVKVGRMAAERKAIEYYAEKLVLFEFVTRKNDNNMRASEDTLCRLLMPHK